MTLRNGNKEYMTSTPKTWFIKQDNGDEDNIDFTSNKIIIIN